MLKKWVPGAIKPPTQPVTNQSASNDSTGQRKVQFPTSDGEPWNDADIQNGLDDFLKVYASKPFENSEGSLSSVGMLGLWTMLRKIRPSLVLESGVFKGQTTWLIENTLPEIPVVCFGADPELLEYVSPTAEYRKWSFHDDKMDPKRDYSNAVAFFDDHSDAFECISKCNEWGIKYILFDDNYPEQTGKRHRSLSSILKRRALPGIKPPREKGLILQWMDWYAIFPPVFDFKAPITEEFSSIDQTSFFGVFDHTLHAKYEVLRDGMSGYRWPTCIKLK